MISEEMTNGMTAFDWSILGCKEVTVNAVGIYSCKCTVKASGSEVCIPTDRLHSISFSDYVKQGYKYVH